MGGDLAKSLISELSSIQQIAAASSPACRGRAATLNTAPLIPQILKAKKEGELHLVSFLIMKVERHSFHPSVVCIARVLTEDDTFPG